MHKKYDAVATIGEYKDREGNTKKRYLTVGAVFENDKGQMALKLDALPTNKDWSGWINFFEPRQHDGHQPQPRQQPAPQPSHAPSEADDDIPF